MCCMGSLLLAFAMAVLHGCVSALLMPEGVRASLQRLSRLGDALNEAVEGVEHCNIAVSGEGAHMLSAGTVGEGF